jgi:hypothetical protein
MGKPTRKYKYTVPVPLWNGLGTATVNVVFPPLFTGSKIRPGRVAELSVGLKKLPDVTVAPCVFASNQMEESESAVVGTGDAESSNR